MAELFWLVEFSNLHAYFRRTFRDDWTSFFISKESSAVNLWILWRTRDTHTCDFKLLRWKLYRFDIFDTSFIAIHVTSVEQFIPKCSLNMLHCQSTPHVYLSPDLFSRQNNIGWDNRRWAKATDLEDLRDDQTIDVAYTVLLGAFRGTAMAYFPRSVVLPSDIFVTA